MWKSTSLHVDSWMQRYVERPAGGKMVPTLWPVIGQDEVALTMPDLRWAERLSFHDDLGVPPDTVFHMVFSDRDDELPVHSWMERRVRVTLNLLSDEHPLLQCDGWQTHCIGLDGQPIAGLETVYVRREQLVAGVQLDYRAAQQHVTVHGIGFYEDALRPETLCWTELLTGYRWGLKLGPGDRLALNFQVKTEQTRLPTPELPPITPQMLQLADDEDDFDWELGRYRSHAE